MRDLIMSCFVAREPVVSTNSVGEYARMRVGSQEHREDDPSWFTVMINDPRDIQTAVNHFKKGKQLLIIGALRSDGETITLKDWSFTPGGRTRTQEVKDDDLSTFNFDDIKEEAFV